MANKFHFSGGYELKSVRDFFIKNCDSSEDMLQYEGLKKSLSSFMVKTDSNLNDIPDAKDNRIAFVLHNVFIRGLPTMASLDLEDEIRNATGAIGFRETKTNSLDHSLLENKVSFASLRRALHIVEPRIDRYTAFENYLGSWEEHGSEFEERYLYKEIPSKTFNGRGDFLIQLFQPQRSIGTIVPEGRDRELREQNVDFALEYPYPVNDNKRKGFCIEIDGSQHEENRQKYLDRKRDDALLESDWANTVRLKTKEFNDAELGKHFALLNEREFFKNLFKEYHKNYSLPLYASKEGLLALELILTPYAVARIQYTIIKAVISGVLSFEEEKWKIAVLERDVPCARLAIDDLKRFMNAISLLENKERRFPEIELDVFYTSEFENVSLRQANDLLWNEISNSTKAYDVYIDISILERDGLSKRSEALVYDTYFQIRSAHHMPKEMPSFLTSKRITWGRLVIPIGDDKFEDHPVTSKALAFFIQNIFRKKSFREGQLRILDRALRNLTVIGLLPTGGGKSLTYQLAGILQPGHVIVIDPIKSLMKDQVDSLAKLGITGTVFINSSLKDVEARNQAQNKLSNGKALFCFISPERMMIERFRESLASMANDGHYFSYGVIDEVHCVSEWGHNFRTPYLSLGKNMLDFCKAADGKIALFGLTATASFDVLSDVQRELSGNQEDQMIPDEAIVRHENTNRNELQYHIEVVKLPEPEIEEIKRKNSGDFFELGVNEAIGRAKQACINQLLTNPGLLLKKFNRNVKEVINDDLIKLTYPEGQYPNSDQVHRQIQIATDSYENDFWTYSDEEGKNNGALIFAPHKTWYFGVTDKYRTDSRKKGIAESILRAGILPQEKVGTFIGVDSDHEATGKKIQEDNDFNQEAFVESRQQLMVATKAFGMGIDKPNIRLTIHNNFPDSIESFVQEAGRGGRDRRLSVACIVLNDQKIEDPYKRKVYSNDLDIQKSFFSNSFKGETHEKWVLFELLNEIIFPQKNRISQLTRILNDHQNIIDLGKKIWVNHYQVKSRLYINGPNKEDYGYFDYLNGELVSKWANVGHEVSTMALMVLKSIIQEVALGVAPENLQVWLNESQGSEKKPGIERILSRLEFGKDFEILIPFTNDHEEVCQNIAKAILELYGRERSAVNIKEYSGYVKKAYSSRLEKFLENIDRNIGILNKINGLSIEQADLVTKFQTKLQNQLYKRRDKQDTEKAIFRFSVIGLIDDYTVDYNSETYVLKGRKKFPEEYHKALRFYISKYYSQKRTDHVINELSSRKGDTEVQRLLNFITDFVYSEIAKKRNESIDFMQQCCIVGLEKGNVEMKTWIHLYFNSKYARKGYKIQIEDKSLVLFAHIPDTEEEQGLFNVSLLDWTNEGQIEEFDFILDFMHLMEIDPNNSERDNLKHLRGACTRLIMANPENYVFRLLKAFAVLVLEELKLTTELQKSIMEDLKRGYINLLERESEKADIDDLILQYKAVMLSKLQQEQAQQWFREVMENLEFLAHVEWTNRFKEKFTNDLIV